MVLKNPRKYVSTVKYLKINDVIMYLVEATFEIIHT